MPELDRVFTYVVQMKTEDDCPIEGYRLSASDVCAAMIEAHRQADPKHPGSHLRVVSVREIKEQHA